MCRSKSALLAAQVSPKPGILTQLLVSNHIMSEMLHLPRSYGCYPLAPPFKRHQARKNHNSVRLTRAQDLYRW